MKIFNSLTREVEEFKPLKAGKVGMYTCGMTVYGPSHIGHGKKYVVDDLLKRLLTYNGYEVMHVQNVTDVGHLVSDEDEGEDKMEKGAKKTGKTVWEVADYYTKDFYSQMDLLNIIRPNVIAKATDHVPEQIDLTKRLLEKGFAYETPEAVYFNVARFPRYESLFGRQSLKEKQVATREEVHTGEHKKNPEDFVLWFKAVGKYEHHIMQWESPWGKGFPGWHIECSAMSMKYLGETFDIHTGGEDHLSVHHPNEVAQSEAAIGKPLAKYWVHTMFLMVDGTKMSKSLGNVYQVSDVVNKGFSPMALRYLFLTAHYRVQQNFTWSAMAAAQSAYDKLMVFVQDTRKKSTESSRTELSPEKLKKLDEYKNRFEEAINNDLNFPQAIAVMWEMLKSNIPDYDKMDTLLDWDQVLGLKLNESGLQTEEIPEEVKNLAHDRQQLREMGKYVEADGVRMQIEKLGWTVKDTKLGPELKKK